MNSNSNKLTIVDYCDILQKNHSIEELESIYNQITESNEDELDEETREQYPIISDIFNKLETGMDMREIIREAIHYKVKSSYKHQEVFKRREAFEQSEEKKKELYEIFDNLNQHIQGKSIEEVTAFFASLKDIMGQICMQQTSGVIVVKTKLSDFLSLPKTNYSRTSILNQDMFIIFSPEEITAMQMKVVELDENDAHRPLITAILDQAYDTVHFNELSGQLVIMMSKYFIEKLYKAGLKDHIEFIEFSRQFVRNKKAFEKALQDLEDIEQRIEKHLKDRPVLNEFPKFLRALLQIKIGLMDSTYAQKILMSIKLKGPQYLKAKKAVSIDFDRFPEYQHQLILRHSASFSLQKKILAFTFKQFEADFKAVSDELKSLMEDIETASDKLDPNSDEYKSKLLKKANLQRKLEQSRRELDVVRSQIRLVDIQHKMAKKAIKRINERKAAIEQTEVKAPTKIEVTPKVNVNRIQHKSEMVYMSKRKGK